MKVITSVVFETPNSNQGHIFSYQWAMITLGRAAVDKSCLSRGASSDHCGTGETIKTKPLSGFILWKEICHVICILRLSALAGLEQKNIYWSELQWPDPEYFFSIKTQSWTHSSSFCMCLECESVLLPLCAIHPAIFYDCLSCADARKPNSSPHLQTMCNYAEAKSLGIN